MKKIELYLIRKPEKSIIIAAKDVKQAAKKYFKDFGELVTVDKIEHLCSRFVDIYV